MAKINSYRRRWLRYHKGYEKRAYKIFKAVFKKWSKDIPLDEMTIFNYPEVLDRSIDEEDMFKAYEEVYLNVGLMHGRRLKKEVQEKFFDLDDFPTIFKEFIQNWLRTNAADNIVSIARTFKAEIRQILTQGIQNGRTIQELTTDLNKMLKRPGWYRWQSARIARTETTTSANLATIKQAELLPYYADKLWISGSDARVRRFPVAKYDHLQMNGKKAGLADYFEVPNTEIGFKGQLLYPGDPIGRAGNIINCRCTIGIVGKRDKNGMLIMKQGGSPTFRDTTFTPAKTIVEAEQWAIKQGYVKNPNYSNIDLKRANEINKTLNKIHKGKPLNEIRFEKDLGIIRNNKPDSQIVGLYDNKKNVIYLQKDLPLKLTEKQAYRKSKKYIVDKYNEWKNALLDDPNNNFIKDKVKNLKILSDNWERHNVGETLSDIFTHEYGHKLDFMNLLSKFDKYNNFYPSTSSVFVRSNLGNIPKNITQKEFFTKLVSEYSTTNRKELFAEAYTMYIKGEKLPGWFVKLIEKIINNAI